MKEALQGARDFKIIPANFKSSGEFEIISIDDNSMKIKLNLMEKSEFDDYVTGAGVEVFGVNNVGLIYFETKILDKTVQDDNFILTLAQNIDFSIIQRREYSRVALSKGNFIFKDMPPETVVSVEDISAGGIKFISKEPLELDKFYDIEIHLSNNMKIECSLQPVRIAKENEFYSISGKFVNLENADRIVLVQYAFKIKMEEQNKEDGK